MTERVIELSADASAVIAELNKVNSLLSQMHAKASQVPVGPSQMERAFASLGNTIGSVASGIKNIGISIGAVAAGAIVGIGQIEKSLGSISKGFKDTLAVQSTGFAGLAFQLSGVTNGLIDVQSASEFIRKGKGLGMTDDQINKVVKMGTNLGLVSKDFNSVTATQKIFAAVAKGNIESIDEVSTSLSNAIKHNKEYQSAQGHQAKQQAMLNVLMNRFNQTLEETGNAADSSFGRMIGMIEKVKQSSEGLGGVLKGVAGVAAGVLGPIGTATAAGFMAGPVVGAISMALGAVVSGALATGLVKLGGMLANDKGGDLGAKISALSMITQQFLAAGAMYAFSGKGSADVPMDVLAAAGMTADDAQKLFEKFIGGAKVLRSFTDGFGDSFSTVRDIFSSVTNERFSVGNIGLDKMAGSANTVGDILGTIAGILVSISEVLVTGFIELTSAVDNIGTDILQGMGIDISKVQLFDRGFDPTKSYERTGSISSGLTDIGASQSITAGMNIHDPRFASLTSLAELRTQLFTAQGTVTKKDDIGVLERMEMQLSLMQGRLEFSDQSTKMVELLDGIKKELEIQKNRR